MAQGLPGARASAIGADSRESRDKEGITGPARGRWAANDDLHLPLGTPWGGHHLDRIRYRPLRDVGRKHRHKGAMDAWPLGPADHKVTSSGVVAGEYEMLATENAGGEKGMRITRLCRSMMTFGSEA